MKKKINKAAWEKLSAELQALYKLVGNDYILELEDDDEPPEPGDGNAKTALERKHRKAAEKQRDELQAQLEALQAEKETATNGSAAMKAAHERKVTKLEKDRDEALLKFRTYVGDKLKGDTADTVAAKLTKSPKLLLPHILARLDVDYDGDEPTLVVLDGKGKKSALTVDDLAKEFRDNKEFAGIVVASQASGGGASRPGVTAPNGSALGAGNTPPNNGTTPPPSYAKMRPSELAAQIKANQAAKAAAAT